MPAAASSQDQREMEIFHSTYLLLVIQSMKHDLFLFLINKSKQFHNKPYQKHLQCYGSFPLFLRILLTLSNNILYPVSQGFLKREIKVTPTICGSCKCLSQVRESITQFCFICIVRSAINLRPVWYCT